MIDNKLLVSYAGVVAFVPAKPFLALAAVGAVALCAAGYLLFANVGEE